MSLRTFDTELEVGSYFSAFLCIPAVSCLRSPDFLHGVSDERLTRICFSGFHILWKRYLFKFLWPKISSVFMLRTPLVGLYSVDGRWMCMKHH